MHQNNKKIIEIIKNNNLFEILKENNFEQNNGEFIFFNFDELSPSFKKNIGIKILDLNNILSKFDLIYNIKKIEKIYFKNYQSFVFDKNEIKLVSDYNTYIIDFYSNFIGPLSLLNINYDYIKYSKFYNNITIEESNLINPSFFLKLLIFSRKIKLFNDLIYKVITRLYGNNNLSILFKFNKLLFFYEYVIRRKKLSDDFYRKILVKYFFHQLTKINFDIKLKWTDYYRNKNIADLLKANIINNELNNTRDIKIYEFLKKYSYLGSLHDIGSNAGYYSILALKSGFKKIISSDSDYGAIDNFYNFVNENNLNIYCIISNFKKINKHNIIDKKTEVVLALGFTHHMRLVEIMPWDLIAEKLSLFTNKILITEFKNHTKAANINSKLTQSIIDYNLQSFISSLNKYFKKCEVIGDYSIGSDKGLRTLIICEK